MREDGLLTVYNATPHASTGYSPFYLILGKEANLLIEFMLNVERDNNDKEHSIDERLEIHLLRLHEAYIRAAEQLRK